MTVADEAAMPAPSGRASAREDILQAAKGLFAERGYDGVSISDIAGASGVSKANIFHHFESKEGLYLAVIASVVARIPDQAERFAEEHSIVQSFQNMAAAELSRAAEDEQGVRLILQEIISDNPLRSRVLAEEIFADSFTRLVGRIRAQQAAGRFRRDFDPVLAAAVLRSATAFYVLTRSVQRHLPGVTFADDPERYGHEAVELILRGLVAADGQGEA